MLHGRYAKAVRSLFGLEASQVGILPELLPTVEIMRADGSTAYARGENMYSCYAPCGAVAGQLSRCVFRNPATSPKLAVFEYIQVWNGAAAITCDIRMERGGTAVATAVTVAARDARIWSDVPPYTIPNSVEVTRGSVAAATATVLHTMRTSAANVPDTFMWPIVLLPGTSLYVTGTVVNTTIAMNFGWFERVIDGAEYG